ncbi:MAG TPA: GTP 3',8-cyclase MoaA, partial [Saprospiraceae bacterium]|nr:GTP 3',8-cyclase MoaA [Saprospiraceae bacterium]
MIVDGFNRVHDYLRISLTDNCNLRCFYCMPDEHYDFTPASRLMQVDEIEAISRIFVANGVRKIRLTGGEPLVRKDAAEIIRKLAALPVKLTLTTNGTRLHEFVDVIKEAGITSLNISLDTLDKDRFMLMTKRDQFARVMSNINMMIDSGFHVKVNVVVMKGLNDHEVADFIRWTKQSPIHVRFIEFMPFSGNRWNSDRVMTWQQILELASHEFDIEPIQREKHETAKKYMIPGAPGTFAVISTMSAPFCGDCNRMRLTADGKMKNCLFSQTETDLLT